MSFVTEEKNSQRSNSHTQLNLSPELRHKSKKSKYNITHLLHSEPMLDEHLRWKFLKSKVKQYKKKLKAEIEHLKEYPTEIKSNPQALLQNITEIISTLLKMNGTAEFRVNLVKSELSPDDQVNLLLIDPEESIKLSVLRAKIEGRLVHTMMPKSLKDWIIYLHQKAKNLDDLFILTHTLIPENWRKELPDLLLYQNHRSFTPICFSHEPKFGEKTTEEVARVFSAHSDYLSTSFKINGKHYHCPGKSAADFKIKFIESLNNEGWEPQLDPAQEEHNQESPFSNFIKALAFNTLTQSLTAHKQHFSDPLAKKFKVQQTKRNRIFSIYFKNPNNFTVIRKFTWDVRHILPDQTLGYSVLIYHMFTALTFCNSKWSETLFIKNVTILDSSQQKFLEFTFQAFEKWIQTTKH